MPCNRRALLAFRSLSIGVKKSSSHPSVSGTPGDGMSDNSVDIDFFIVVSKIKNKIQIYKYIFLLTLILCVFVRETFE